MLSTFPKVWLHEKTEGQPDDLERLSGRYFVQCKPVLVSFSAEELRLSKYCLYQAALTLPVVEIVTVMERLNAPRAA